MKKIFTLIAVAAMALSTYAQGTYALKDTDTDAIKAGTQIKSVDNITMTYGVEGSADFKAPSGKPDAKLEAILGATAYTEGNGVNGNKDNGTIYLFEPAQDGILTVGAVINGGKNILVKKDFYTGEDVSYKIYDNDGTTEVEVTDGQVSDKVYGLIVLDVKAGTKYSISLSGSKMGFYGFKFELSTNINTVKAAAEDGAIYNLAGQKVDAAFKGIVIKNGRKMIQ